MKIEHVVIGDCNSFKLAMGKYAFLSCDYIPKDYLKSLLDSEISDEDRKIISEYINKQSNG